MTLEQRLEKIESLLVVLVERETVKDFYEIEEFARLVGKSCFTCREWCRLGRIRARKKVSGRGAYTAWAISHEELQRYQKEGLLPNQRGSAIGRGAERVPYTASGRDAVTIPESVKL
jgi:hypothetical protein